MKEMDRKRLLCDSCGGLLTVDITKQTAVCQFCGMTYDYSYFNGNDTLEKADSFLAAGEFNAARDALTFLLKKDPHNPDALAKLMLVEFKLKSESDLGTKQIIDSLKGDPDSVKWIIEQADEASRGRLLELHGKIVTAFKCAGINSEIQQVEKDIKETEERSDKISLSLMHEEIPVRSKFRQESDEYLPPLEYWNKNRKITLFFWVVVILFHLPLLAYGAVYFFIMALIYSAVFLIPLFYIYNNTVKPALRRIEDYKKEKQKLAAELESLKTKRLNLQNEYNTLRRSIKPAQSPVLKAE